MADLPDRHGVRTPGGRASGLGLGRAAASAAVTVVVVASGALLTGCGSSSHHNGLIGYPSYLPKYTLNDPGAQPLVGTASRPALTNQGQAVRVETPRWSVLAVVSGPQVPGEGLPYQAPTTTCTWTVTLSQATGPVPISVADFDSIDNFGNVYRPYLVPGQPAPPGVLRPNQRVSFDLRAGEAVGEGLMRWAPNGSQIVAKWDFVVEND